MGWADALSGIDWGGMVKAAVPAAIGTYIAGNANRRAAETFAGASDRATQQMTAGSQAGQARLAAVADRTAPAVDYLRSVMADQTLTPGQQQRVMDVRRDTGTALSSRLGGRSATAIATQAAKNLEDSIYEANRSRADRAAGTLAGQNTAAINAAAGQDIALGRDIAGITGRTGENIAGADLATGQLQGQMVGDILSPMSELRKIIAEERKGSASDRDINSYSARWR